VHRASTRTGARNLEDYARLLDRFGVDHTLLEAGEVASRWPQFRFDGGEQAIYQRDTGIVDAARANAVHAALARAHGAQAEPAGSIVRRLPRGRVTPP